MNKWTDGARWRAAGTAILLLVAGGVMGVLVDRLWVSPPESQAAPLTVEAMATRLGLSSSEAAHVQMLLDSLHAEIHAAVEQGPDSLRTAVRNAQRRIEAALPPEARPEFRAWMHEQYEHMMGRRHGGPMDHGMMHRGGSMGPEGMSPPRDGAGRGVDTAAPHVR
ncbi:MAG: hypothetical protein HY704_10270 [Gemmatimonadetes bacterium]|nr:hypothetical protein [Gemmatimonadota bacterium]